MLYLISTPLGNLKDITIRAIEILKLCDLILCEDTRHSRVLLDHYEIQRPLKSLHKFNETEQLHQILDALKANQNIALISDAGTPCIQDPGAILVKACREEKIAITAIPGPCAFAMALSLCGEEEGPFQFVGFFPKKEQALKKTLLSLLEYDGHSFGYLSPHQVLHLLELLSSFSPDRPLILFKELTKFYESSYEGSALELYNTLKLSSIKGEFVLMIKRSTEKLSFDNLSLADHVAELEKTYQLSKNEAIKLAAKQRGMPKREVYNFLLPKNSD